MMIDKQLFKNMKVNYVSNHDGKEYAITIGHVGSVDDKYLSGSQPYGGYLGIDMVNGELTKEYISLNKNVKLPATGRRFSFPSRNK